MPETLQDFKAQLFRTLASRSRVRILELLRASGTLTVGELQQRLAMDSSNVSQHLAILRSAGVVSARREGNNVWYSVEETAIFALLDAARTVFEHQAAARNLALQEETAGEAGASAE